jgi:hypothetical protein
LCFDILDLEKKTIPVDNFSKPKLENKREYVKLKGIENIFNNNVPPNGFSYRLFDFNEMAMRSPCRKA